MMHAHLFFSDLVVCVSRHHPVYCIVQQSIFRLVHWLSSRITSTVLPLTACLDHSDPPSTGGMAPGCSGPLSMVPGHVLLLQAFNGRASIKTRSSSVDTGSLLPIVRHTSHAMAAVDLKAWRRHWRSEMIRRTLQMAHSSMYVDRRVRTKRFGLVSSLLFCCPISSVSSIVCWLAGRLFQIHSWFTLQLGPTSLSLSCCWCVNIEQSQGAQVSPTTYVCKG